MSIKGWVKNWLANWKAELAELERQAEEHPRIRVSLSGGLYVDSEDRVRSKSFQRTLVQCEALHRKLQAERKRLKETSGE